jgi:peptide/nickel transport system ATP-binding protein
MSAVLELRDINKTYTVSRGMFRGKQPLRAVNGVSLSLNKGDVLGLVGESGCGKTTLAKILLGLEQPTAGQVLIDSEDMTGRDRRHLAQRIQPIFQDPYSSLNPRKRIHDIVSLPLRVHKIGTPDSWQPKVEAILERVGLPKRVANNYPNQLSGGQRQRVAIARALIMQPEIVICDEPTSALDVSVQSQILNLLLELREDMGLTYLFISHNLAVVEHLATRVAVMYLGRLVEQASTDAVFERARHPYTQALLSSVLTPEPGLGIPDTHLGTAYPNPIAPPSGCTFHPRCGQALAICKTTPPALKNDELGWVECHLHNDANTP